MIEALITCCNPCDIPDLGIVGLKRGEERWVSDAAALGSTDLRREQAKGNIRVSRKSRRANQNPKRPPPPFVAQSRPQNTERPENKVIEKVVEKVVEKTVVQEVDTEKLKSELLGDLIPGLRAAIAEEVGKMASQMPAAAPQNPAPPAASLDAAQLEGVLESVLRRVAPSGVSAGASSSSSRPKSGPEEPLFIPNKIVSKDTKGKIDITQKASEGAGDLDDAQAALRALKRKKSGKKNVDKENES